jgi:O-methyltransferase
MTISPRDMRLRIPGFRRYAAELERLRGHEGALEAMRQQLEKAEREVRVLSGARGMAPGNNASVDDAEWTTRAKKYEYYWLNADKKIDLLEMRPFGALASEVLRDGRTFLNADRLYTLWQAVAHMPAGAAAIAEVGVYRGGSARFLAEALRAVDRVMPLYACDTFDGHAAVDESVDGRHKVQKQFAGVNTSRIAKYLNRYDFVHIVEGDITQTAARFEDQHAFGLVHIDVDVYPATGFCLEFFAPRLLVGATIVVDDYGFTTCRGAKKAVDEFVAANGKQFWAMHLLTGQAVLTRLA